MGESGGRPQLGVGCVGLGSMGREGVRLVQQALDLGVRVFDTADAYGSGRSERMLGRALRGRRDEAFVATKGGYVFRERSAMMAAGRSLARGVRKAPHRSAPGSARGAYARQDFTPGYLRTAVDASLRRLGTDVVDLYQLHGPNSVHDDVLAVMADLRAEGKIRRFGIGLERLERAHEWIELDELDSILIPFGVLDPHARERLIPGAAERGVSVAVRGVFAGGFFARERRQDTADLRAGQPELLEALCRLADSAGVRPLQIAMWFITARLDITTVLIGMSSGSHLVDTFELFMAEPDLSVMREVETILSRSATPSDLADSNGNLV